jgi:hypothetical protein
MQFTTDQFAMFKMVFESPTDDHLKRLTPTEHEQFIFYLFERDGLSTNQFSLVVRAMEVLTLNYIAEKAR